MGREDWYRSETWSESDQQGFYSRLKRSRGSFHKAQYLRIQAATLASVGLHQEAIVLLDDLLTNHPDKSQIALARNQKAEALVLVGRIDDAVDQYRRSLQAERDYPTLKSGCWLSFACLVAFGEITRCYAEALGILREFKSSAGLLFPVQRFQYNAALALIAEAEGQHTVAGEFARSALANAEATDSGLRYHPTLGLVQGVGEKVKARLAAMAGVEPAAAVDRPRVALVQQPDQLFDFPT